MNNNSVSKIIVLIISMCLVIGIMPSYVFASVDNSFVERIEAEKVVDLVDCIVEEENSDVQTQEGEKSEDGYEVSLEGMDVSIPFDGDDSIQIDTFDDSNIEIELPEVIDETDVLDTSDGSVVYGGDEVNLTVQGTEEPLGEDIIRSGVRVSIFIENKDAPKEYEFEYNLPKGYELVLGDTFDDPTINKESVLIIKDEEYIVSTIEAPWAKDAEGNDLKTYYKVKGNTIIQHVEFDDNTKFPVVADPSTIVDSKVEVKKTYSKWISAYAKGQGKKGTYCPKGGAQIIKGYSTTTKKTVSVDAGLSGEKVSLSVGYVKEKSSSNCTAIALPMDGHWYKVRYYEKWVMKYKEKYNKYRKIKIRDNGKTKVTTYEWILVDKWVTKYKYLGDSLKAVRQ